MDMRMSMIPLMQSSQIAKSMKTSQGVIAILRWIASSMEKKRQTISTKM